MFRERSVARILDLCTLIIALGTVGLGAHVYRQMRAPSGPGAVIKPTTVKNWRSYAVGHRIGSDAAPVVITEFSDFQCPFCAKMVTGLKQLIAASGGRVALVYRHYPITTEHPFAIDAALASECADHQGRFAAFHDALFASATEIGRRSFSEFAREAGVKDSAAFAKCLEERKGSSQLAADVRAAEQLGVRGTPVFLVNDQFIAGAEPALIDSVVKHLLSRSR